ncbi:hypothetical protein [Sulfurospirillum tamanense]|nr:hypothetical protein [Sulfurospirillum tamanensis]
MSFPLHVKMVSKIVRGINRAGAAEASTDVYLNLGRVALGVL